MTVAVGQVTDVFDKLRPDFQKDLQQKLQSKKRRKKMRWVGKLDERTFLTCLRKQAKNPRA